MKIPLPNLAQRLNRRRKAVGMSYPSLADRCGLSVPTVKRILGGRVGDASFENVEAVAAALGIAFDVSEIDVDEMCRRQARMKAEQIARLVQGTSALESQGVDSATYQRLVEKSYHELLAGSARRLWSA